MNIKVLKSEKDEIELEIPSLTIVEVLRNYLNEDSGVDFAAWKREHPSENPILKVSTKGKTAKKAVNDAIVQIEKDLDKVGKEFGNLK